jgi:hypothetical protein
VLVVQHDRPLCSAVPLAQLLDAFADDDDVCYVCLPTLATVGYPVKLVSRGWAGSLFSARAIGGVALQPLAATLDSTHLARVRWYDQRVFGERRPAHLPRGAFVEDTFGQAQLAEVRAAARAGGLSAQAEVLRSYGTWVLAACTPMVSHLDGHDAGACRVTWRKWRHADEWAGSEELLAQAEREAGGCLPPPPDSCWVPGFVETAAKQNAQLAE